MFNYHIIKIKKNVARHSLNHVNINLNNNNLRNYYNKSGRNLSYNFQNLLYRSFSLIYCVFNKLLTFFNKYPKKYDRAQNTKYNKITYSMNSKTSSNFF